MAKEIERESLAQQEITAVRDGICTANLSKIFAHHHFNYDLIECKM